MIRKQEVAAEPPASVVTARLAAGKEVGPDDFADITTAKVVEIGWASGESLRVEFAGQLTADEVAAVERRITSRSAAEEQLREEMAAFLTLPGPSAQDVADQVARLTRILLSGPIQ